MRFIFSTGSLYTYSIERSFAFAQAAGFDGVEVMVDQRWDTRQAPYLHALMTRFELPILVLHAPLAKPVPGWPADQPGRIRRTVALAEAVGAEVVVHHLPRRLGFFRLMTTRGMVPIPRLRNPERAYANWLETEYPVAQANTPVILCIENIPAVRVFGRKINPALWNTPDDMLRFPHITLDTTHLATWGLDPVAVFTQWGGRVGHIHLSNYQAGTQHLRPEIGSLRLDRFLGAVASSGYHGAVSLELHPHNLLAGQPDGRIVAALERSLAWCRACV